MAQQKRIVLVGGAGFIGHHLALALKENGHDVHIIDGLHVNHLLSFVSEDHAIPHRAQAVRMLLERLDVLRRAGIPLYVQDARDYHALSKQLEAIQPQVFVLLAAVSHADRSNKDPYSTFDHSLRTLENALDYARASASAEHFIFLSSSMVYGHFETQKVTEESPCDPLGIYGALKLSGEKIIQAYHNVFGLPYTIIRPSALYGPRCVSRRVAQIFVENAINGEPITVRGSGEDRLDFTYIDDLVDGMVRVVENEKSRNELFNMTYGESRSLMDLTQGLLKHFPDLDIRYAERDHLMPERGTLSVDKAKKLIGYDPKYSIEEGIAEYISWYRSFLG